MIVHIGERKEYFEADNIELECPRTTLRNECIGLEIPSHRFLGIYDISESGPRKLMAFFNVFDYFVVIRD